MAIDNLVDNRPQLAIDLIRTDGGTQPRAELNQAHLDELVELLNEGRTFKDPVIVFYDGSNYWLADGFHRLNATKIAGFAHVDVDVRSGTQDDAIEYSCGANATHGLKRTRGDIKRAVERLMMLPKWKNAKQKDIAKKCNASESFVSEVLRKIRNEDLTTNPPVEPVEEDQECVTLRTPREVVAQWFADNPELEYLSNREIARRCGVTEGTVRNYRKELLEEEELAEQEVLNLLKEQAAPESITEPEPASEPIEDVIATPEPEPVSEPKQPIEEHTVVIPEPEPEPELVEATATPDTSEQEALAPAVVATEDVEEEEEETHVQSQGLPPALTSSESNEWYTPAQYVYAARELMHGIDVDPASNATANKIIKALTYYDIESNGLDKPWYGRVWLNPPYGRDNGGSNQEVWSHRLLEQYKAGITKEAVLLVNANIDAKWFQPLYDYLICFVNHRIKFYRTDGTPNQPTHGNALVYLGHQQERFIEIFEQFGVVLERARRKIA